MRWRHQLQLVPLFPPAIKSRPPRFLRLWQQLRRRRRLPWRRRGLLWRRRRDDKEIVEKQRIAK